MVGAAFVALLVDLQAIRPDELRLRGEEQRVRTRTIAAYRGSVVDRSGFVLATSTPGHRVEADPTMVVSAQQTAAMLAPILDADPVELAAELAGDSPRDQYALLARSVPEETVAVMEALADADETEDAMVGVFIRPEEDRIYPADSLAKPIVGRVDIDKAGISGIEQQYDDAMTGQNGMVEFERGRFGSISVGDYKVDPATAGYDVVLTIDHRIQWLAEDALVRHCEDSRADGASAVVTDPATGEILAMANVRRNDDGDCVVPGSNAALVWAFEPGSVLKPITIAAAVEELDYSSNTLIEVPPRVSIGGKQFIDDPPHPGAPYPISQILSDSMNVGTIQVAQNLGPTQVHEYLTRFGFGQRTGLEFKGETSGRVRDPEDWYGSDAGSIPIGQGVLVTPTQLVQAYGAIANGGLQQPPLLVKALRAPDGTVIAIDPGPAKPVVSSRTAEELVGMLTGVVRDGTGKRAGIDGYQVAGKTGTAWKAFDDGSGTFGYGEPGNRRYVVTFAGFVPADDPALSMVVVVDEPKEAYTASAVAAPIFAEIGEYALRILGVAPDGAIVTDGRARAVPAVGGSLAGETVDASRSQTGSQSDPQQAPESDPVAEVDTANVPDGGDEAAAPAGDG